MVIAIAYDDVYREARELWDMFITLATSRGHTVVCFSHRTVDERIAPDQSPAMLVHYIGQELPTAYFSERDIHPDVWILD